VDKPLSSEPILVIGHRNPDTDAIASAVGYAWVLNGGEGGRYSPGRTGEVNPQTAYVLKRFGVEPPPLVGDVWGRVGAIIERIPPLDEGATLLTAIQTIAKTRRSVPIHNAAGIPVGIVSGAGLFGSLAEALSSTSVIALANTLGSPAEQTVDPGGVMLKANERIRDVIAQAMRADQDEFIITDEEGRYAGMCRKSALLAPPRRKVVMVDHNELGQAVPGLEDAEIVEVLDHHRLDTMPTAMPIRFLIEPVGCCATLVAERGLERGLTFPAPIAGLLLCAILSDTLVFRSPTTTERDRAAAGKLAAMAGLSGETAIYDLGEAMLAAGAGMGGRVAAEMINADLKFYEVGGGRVGIAQVETANLSEIADHLAALRSALEDLSQTRELAMSMLMVTDVVRGNSRLIVAAPSRLIASLPYVRLDDGTLDAPGLVSRKKQLLPVVLGALSQVV